MNLTEEFKGPNTSSVAIIALSFVFYYFFDYWSLKRSHSTRNKRKKKIMPKSTTVNTTDGRFYRSIIDEIEAEIRTESTIAGQTDLSKYQQEKLAGNNNWEVRAALVQNTNISKEVSLMLADNEMFPVKKQFSIQYPACRNPMGYFQQAQLQYSLQR